MKVTRARLLLIASCIVLGATTIYWSFLGAMVHQLNSDQLADPALFHDWATFSQSIFPSQHTFLLKWPLFYAVQLAHATPVAFAAGTIVLCVLTVGLLAWLVSRIEKRPAVLALLYLAMSSMLLMVPIEPAPGTLLPVGMGMLATRNVEYLVFIGAILLLLQPTTRRLLSWRHWAGVGLLALLVVSDQLFIGIAVGAAGLFIASAYVFKKNMLRAKVWIFAGGVVIAILLSLLILQLMRLSGVVDSPTGAVGPYGLNTSLKDGVLAAIYGVLGLMSQFGANPVSNTVIANDLAGAIMQSFRSLSIISYLVNGALFVAIVVAIGAMTKRLVVRQKKREEKKYWTSLRILGLIGVFATIVSIGLFVVTKHYYAVDARYMGVAFFTGVIVLALYARDMTFSMKRVAVIASILLISCSIGIYASHRSYEQSRQAYMQVERQDAFIAAALKHRPVKTLIGDYWRVYPIVSKAQAVRPLPLQGCLEPRDVLTSRYWRQDVYKNSFAYFLTTRPTGTGYPGCELSKVRQAFGSPSDTLIIEGTAQAPRSMILFYDKGVNQSKGGSGIRPDGTSLARTLSDLKDTSCQTGRAVMQTIAHQDDDMLFMNPDLMRGVRSGDCIRTVYFTAGDAGLDAAYWLAREEGAKAAYARLFQIDNPTWRSRDIILSPHHQVKITHLVGQNRASLIFLHLPDGGVDGSGFWAYRHESLSKLVAGTLSSIGSVDGMSRYSLNELTSTLEQLYEHYQPALIRTQALRNHSRQFSDHSDHLAVGQVTHQAFNRYHQTHPDVPLIHYIGYPIRAREANVSGDDLLQKKQMFYYYARHDGSTCASDSVCEKTAYGYYLDRQYIE